MAFTLVDTRYLGYVLTSNEYKSAATKVAKAKYLDETSKAYILGYAYLIDMAKETKGNCTSLKAYVVNAVTARPGFGPLLYDICMSWTTKNGYGLTGHRSLNKPAAIAVWDYYLKKRSDVKAVRITSLDCIHLKEKDPNSALNHAFYINNPVDISKLLAKQVPELSEKNATWIGQYYFDLRYYYG